MVKAKQALRPLMVGVGVVFLTPMIASFVGGIGFLSGMIPGINISFGTALSAGAAAFGMDYAATKLKL